MNYLFSPEKEDHTLTLEELKRIPGFENIPDEQGKHLIQTCSIFCEIVYSIHASQKNAANNEASHLQAA